MLKLRLEERNLGLRQRSSCGSSPGGGVSPMASSPSHQSMAMAEADAKLGYFKPGDITPSTIKKPPHQGGTDSGSPDSGYNGVDELSYLDLDMAESSISEDSTSRSFDYVTSDIIPADGQEVAGTKEEGGRPWNIHFLTGLLLLIILGACGFGLLLTFRHLDSPDMTEGLGGKYKAIQFARERILEQERRAREAVLPVGGEDFEDYMLVAGEDSEDPDDPQFRAAAPRSVAAAGMKNDAPGDGAGFRVKRQEDGEDPFRVHEKREVREDAPGQFRLVGEDEAF